MTIEEQVFNKRYSKIIKSLNIATKLPYYKELIEKECINIENIKSYKDFTRLPILDKPTYRDNMFNFIPIEIYEQGFDIEEYNRHNVHLKSANEYLKQFGLLLRTTSGSTGLPLEIIIHELDLRNAYLLLNKFRSKIRKGFFNFKFTWIWFENSRGYKKEKDKYIQINMHGFQYYVYSISDDEFDALVEFLKQKNISWLISTPTFLALFSEYILKNGIEIQFSFVECQSEYLFTWQKEIIAKALKTNPINIYSSNEVHFIGAECDNNKLHILDDNVFVELLDNDFGKKDVIVTNLNCQYMPLVRYKIGDVGEWDDTNCGCDFLTPILNLEQFRVNDMISLKNGEKLDYWIIAESITHIKHDFGIDFEQFQVVQVDYEHFEYFIKTNYKIDEQLFERILDYLNDYFFEIFKYKVHVELKFQEEIIHNYIKTKYQHFFNAIEHRDILK